MKKQNYYQITEGDVTRNFVSERAATICYWKGLTHRADRLANSYFIDQIVFNPGDRVIDCGANVGDLELYFYLNKIDVHYTAFEPSPKEFKCLENNLSLGEAYNLGLWDSDGELKFHVSSKNSDSSFIAPPSFTEEISVATIRLDALVDSHVKLLKVEAEGAEPEVLRGCERILKFIEWITVDVGFERGINQTNTVAEVCNYLIAHGFILEKFMSPTGRWVALFRNPSLANPLV